MFSGIVETTAKVLRVDHPHNSTNVDLTLTVPFWDELAIDQSVAHNGVCLTVVSIHPEEKSYTVTAVQGDVTVTDTFTVTAAGAQPIADGGKTPAEGGLAATGADSNLLVGGIAVALLIAATGATLVAQRRNA